MMSEGFLVFASSSTIGSFLLWTLTFIGTTHLLWTFCSACREKKKKKSTRTPVAADPNDAQTNDGDQQQPVEASKLPPKKDPKTTKSLRESNNIKNSRNGRPKNGKNNKGNYPAQGNTISSAADNTGTKSFATTKGVKPKATAVGNIDEKIKGMPQGQMAEGLALQHRFDHASQKDKFTRNGVSKGVKIVEQENLLYITDDVSKTRSTASSRTAEVAAAAVVPPANEGREPMDSLKYAHHQDSTEEAASTTTGAAGGTAMEEQKPADAAAGEKKETKSRPIKSGQDSDYL